MKPVKLEVDQYELRKLIEAALDSANDALWGHGQECPECGGTHIMGALVRAIELAEMLEQDEPEKPALKVVPKECH